jgi:hypothetical protein
MTPREVTRLMRQSFAPERWQGLELMPGTTIPDAPLNDGGAV